jgi:hypothetical protein
VIFFFLLFYPFHSQGHSPCQSKWKVKSFWMALKAFTQSTCFCLVYSSAYFKQNFVFFGDVLSILYKSQCILSFWFSDIICTNLYPPLYSFFSFWSCPFKNWVHTEPPVKSDPVYLDITFASVSSGLYVIFIDKMSKSSHLSNSHETSNSLKFQSSCIFSLNFFP